MATPTIDPETATCGRCKSRFELPCKVTVVKDTPYHGTCWTCILCGVECLEKFFVDPSTPNDPWCVRCYENSALTCVECGGKIAPGSFFHAKGGVANGPKHAACFRCDSCRREIGLAGNTTDIQIEFYPVDGKVYCSVACIPDSPRTATLQKPPPQPEQAVQPVSQDNGPISPPKKEATSSYQPTRASMVSVQTTADACKVCAKKVYAYEQLRYNGFSFHKLCLRCSKCRATLNVKTAEMSSGDLFCSVHAPKDKSTFSGI